MGFRALRVINEDMVQPGRGFGAHSHRDMEIVTWVLAGSLEHRDSLGNGSLIHPSEVQLMRAGTGVTHSEYNPSTDAPVHFLQIWILPDAVGLPPAYEQRQFPIDRRRNALRVIASPDGREDSARLHQDVSVYAGHLAGSGTVRHDLPPTRHAWVQVTDGRLSANGHLMERGDGAAVSQETTLDLAAQGDTTFLLFDLA
jgi:quercetin 2,3-dioxygenase